MGFKKVLAAAMAGVVLFPSNVFATQFHASAEGIITHQMGHLFFLFSMVVLIFTVTDKGLNVQKGWRLIQYSAFLFVLWNLDAVTAHFFDNQIHAVKIETISIWKMKIITNDDSPFLAWFYYILKLDHLLCVPAMLLLYKGLSNLVENQRQIRLQKER